jgi:hypothetical protein
MRMALLQNFFGDSKAKFILWLTIRGAFGDKLKKIHSNYYVAISNAVTALMLLDKAA